MSDRQYLHNDNRHTPAHSSHSSHPVHKSAEPPIKWPSSEQKQSRNPAEEYARKHVEQAHLQAQQHQASQQTHQPMRNQEYDWSSYHTAWQQYYHQYFYRYYAHWLEQQRAQEQPHQTQAAEPETPDNLRQKIRNDVAERAKKVSSSSHFKPLLAATGVAALFLFINYNQVLVGAIKQYVAPGSTVTTPVIVGPDAAAVGPEPKVVIPKIGVDAPVVYDEPRVDEVSYQKALERGAVRLGTTANPGTKGNVVIGGHSSNNVFNAGLFKYVFVNLRRLEVNDIVYLNYNGKRYTYKITLKKVITPKDTSVLRQTAEPMVTLFTCDPPGSNVNRLVVQATQIDPNPANAEANNNQETKPDETNPLPSVAPSLWDRIFRRG
jgi:sortase A